jgi:hypothetical protein
MLDREALRQYRKRLADLDEELDDAEARHDVARHAKRSAEREALLKELARATGLGGKPRRTGSPTEKARLKYGGIYRSPPAVLENVFAKIQADFESFSIDVGRLIDAGNVVVMQGHYVGKGKATGQERARGGRPRARDLGRQGRPLQSVRRQRDDQPDHRRVARDVDPATCFG